MKVVKKISIKLTLLIGVLVIMNFVYKEFQMSSDVAEFANGYDQMLAKTTDANLIYFGDCSDSYRANGYQDLPGIGELIDEKFGDLNVANLSANGFHPGTYLKLAKMVEHEKHQGKKTFVVTMNLRAFSSKIIHDFTYDPVINRQLQLIDPRVPALVNRSWITYYRNPPNYRSIMEGLIEEGWKRDSLPSNYPHATLYDWYHSYDSEPADWTINNDYAQTYLYDFGFLINDQNQRVQGFDELVELCARNDWDLYFHILPIDFKAATKMVGAKLTRLISTNKKYLVNRYKNVIDNSGLIESEEFIGDYAGSHYSLFARDKMAEQIGKLVLNRP
jgi:hypothetical protein